MSISTPIEARLRSPPLMPFRKTPPAVERGGGPAEHGDLGCPTAGVIQHEGQRVHAQT